MEESVEYVEVDGQCETKVGEITTTGTPTMWYQDDQYAREVHNFIPMITKTSQDQNSETSVHQCTTISMTTIMSVFCSTCGEVKQLLEETQEGDSDE